MMSKLIQRIFQLYLLITILITPIYILFVATINELATLALVSVCITFTIVLQVFISVMITLYKKGLEVNKK